MVWTIKYVEWMKILFKDAMFIDDCINRTKHLDEIFNTNNFVPCTTKACSWMRVMMHAIDHMNK
jgi:hypothetical protein